MYSIDRSDNPTGRLFEARRLLAISQGLPLAFDQGRRLYGGGVYTEVAFIRMWHLFEEIWHVVRINAYVLLTLTGNSCSIIITEIVAIVVPNVAIVITVQYV